MQITPSWELKLAQLANMPLSMMDRQFCLVLFAFSLFLYGNTLSGGAGYVWDDRAAIVSNRDVSGIDPISSIFRHDFWGQDIRLVDSHKSYRPITVLTFRFNHWLHGYSATGFHALNILIYALGVIVYYYWTKQWSTQPVCRVAALFYCCHPIHVEAVASLVGRADSLCGLFYLMAIYLYSHAVRKGDATDVGLLKGCLRISSSTSRLCYFFASFSFAFCASFSKEVGITIFGFFICLELMDILDRRINLMVSNEQDHSLESISTTGETMKLILPVYKYSISSHQLFTAVQEESSSLLRIMLSIIMLLILLFHRYKLSNGTFYKWTILENHISLLPNLQSRTLSYSQTHFWYAFKLIYPRYLCFDYGYSCLPIVHKFSDIRNLLPFSLYLSLATLFIYSVKTMNRSVLVAFLLLVLPLLPALNLFFPVGTVLAERLLFLPCGGFCLILAEALVGNLSPRNALCTEALHERINNSISSSDLNQIKIDKKVSKIYHTFNKKKKIIRTNSSEKRQKTSGISCKNPVTLWQKAKEFTAYPLGFISRQFPFLFCIFICCSFSVRVISRNIDWNSEIRLYRSALEVCPLSVKALTNYATLALAEGKTQEAILAGKTATSVHYGQKAAHLNLGLAYQKNGDFLLSVQSFEAALKMYPHDTKIHGCLGAVLLQWSYVQHVRTDGLDLSTALKDRGIIHLDAAINAGYSAPSILHTRGSLALDAKDYHLALRLLLRALEQNEQNKQSILLTDQLNEQNTLNQLGNVYFHLNRVDEAIEVFERGVLLAPFNMALRTNLGGLYRTLQRGDLARLTMERGLALCNWGEDGLMYRQLTRTQDTTHSTTHGVDGIHSGTNTLQSRLSDSTTGLELGPNADPGPNSDPGPSSDPGSRSGPPPAALLNNLGLVELESGNFKVALFLFEKAAGLETSDGAGSEMKSLDGGTVSDVLRNNIWMAKQGLEDSKYSEL